MDLAGAMVDFALPPSSPLWSRLLHHQGLTAAGLAVLLPIVLNGPAGHSFDVVMQVIDRAGQMPTET